MVGSEVGKKTLLRRNIKLEKDGLINLASIGAEVMRFYLTFFDGEQYLDIPVSNYRAVIRNALALLKHGVTEPYPFEVLEVWLRKERQEAPLGNESLLGKWFISPDGEWIKIVGFGHSEQGEAIAYHQKVNGRRDVISINNLKQLVKQGRLAEQLVLQ